ncbi:hypothetical protein JRO89_XS09G0013500 [Xanthoceras sorbifolium]|uniref:UBA domain-containing protein n=1 Tax=Xanthoceras sorbifolium TaxID=99658 RepID=A0ABQ8HKA8_9ROSI|nr:hypothetical protein JRO89_XS09G0013500 [Xanthoceras sorbifolium]
MDLGVAGYPLMELQVSDEAFSLVMSMGFKEHDAKRALRISNQDIGSAVDFLVEEKAKRVQQRADNNREQKQYGMTPLKKAVDLQRLKAVLEIESRKRKRHQQSTNVDIEQLVSMGFERSTAVEACGAGGSIEQIMHRLLSQSAPNTSSAANNRARSSISTPINVGPSSSGDDENVKGASTTSEIEERDLEMEDELANELTGDVFSDYDFEVTKEGKAINEYLATIDSVVNA